MKLSKEKRDELFLELKDAVLTKKPKKCESIIEKIEKYQLEEKDKDIFDKINKLISKYKFKEALQLLI